MYKKKVKWRFSKKIEARQEVIETKLLFNELEEYMSKKLDFYETIGEEDRKLVKRTMPLHRMMKHMYRRKNWLQAVMKKLQGYVKALETQIEMIKVVLLKEGLIFFAEIDGTP